MEKWAFISDFDGTISDDDFFAYTSRAFFDESALSPWREYLAGERSHFSALKEMFGALRVPQKEFDRFVDRIPFDRGCFDAFSLCCDRNIPIYIVSAGCDYYIKRLIGKEIEKYHIKLLTNSSSYSPLSGLTIEAPSENSPFYDPLTGISKLKLAESLKAEGYKLIFAGDGPPDFEPAQISDVIFARKILLEKCEKAGIKTEQFDSFSDIERYIRKSPRISANTYKEV